MFIFSRTAVHYTFSHVKGLLDSKQFTMLHRKDLQVYTPSGRIGSQLVTSGPLVEAIAGWGRDMLWGHTAQRPPADPELFGEPHGREDSELT